MNKVRKFAKLIIVADKEWTQEEWNAYKKEHPYTKIQPKFKKEKQQTTKSILNDHAKNIKNLGYKIHSKESTPGAHKIWMDGTDKANWENVKKYLENSGMKKSEYPIHGDEDYIHPGTGATVSRQGGGIYIAVPRKSPAGKNWSYGIDS